MEIQVESFLHMLFQKAQNPYLLVEQALKLCET